MIALEPHEQYLLDYALIHNHKEPIKFHGLPIQQELGTYGHMDEAELELAHKEGECLDIDLEFLKGSHMERISRKAQAHNKKLAKGLGYKKPKK